MEKNDLENAFYNDSKYEYVLSLAYEYFLCEDEVGPFVDYSVIDIMWDIESGNAWIPFKREDYDNNEDIQASLALIGLDPDKFWEAMKFIHAYSDSVFYDGRKVEESLNDKMVRFAEALNQESTEITVKIKDKKLFQLSDNNLNTCLIEAIVDYCKKRSDDIGFVGNAINISKEASIERDPSIQIYHESLFYEYLFGKFCTDKELPTRVKGQKGSRNKRLLISRIMYFTCLTRNKVFNEDVNALKGIINKYKDKPIDIVSGRFLV